MQINPHPDLDAVLNALSFIQQSREGDANRDRPCDPLYPMIGILDWTIELQRLIVR